CSPYDGATTGDQRPELYAANFVGIERPRPGFDRPRGLGAADQFCRDQYHPQFPRPSGDECQPPVLPGGGSVSVQHLKILGGVLTRWWRCCRAAMRHSSGAPSNLKSRTAPAGVLLPVLRFSDIVKSGVFPEFDE